MTKSRINDSEETACLRRQLKDSIIRDQLREGLGRMIERMDIFRLQLLVGLAHDRISMLSNKAEEAYQYDDDMMQDGLPHRSLPPSNRG